MSIDTADPEAIAGWTLEQVNAGHRGLTAELMGRPHDAELVARSRAIRIALNARERALTQP